MRKVFTSQAQVDAWLEEIGFVLDEGKAYWAADTERASYLSITQDTNATYTDSHGTTNALANYTSATYCIAEYFEIINGGIAMRFAFGNDGTAALATPLQFAIVAKEDGSGFVYFFVVGGVMKYDNLSGVVSTPSNWTSNNIINTNNIAIITKIYDNIDSFIDAHARTALAIQAVSAASLYTFTCGGKKYLSGLYGNAASIKLGQIVFEVE